MTETEKARDILARTLWGEARGESLSGQSDNELAFKAVCNDR